jgi:tetratricopeptide (TPR) repeat protein
MTCHKAASCTDQPNLPEAVRGDCAGCHMPRETWMNSHFYTAKDDDYLPVGNRSEHRIGIYPHAKKAVLLAWLRTVPDKKAEAEELAAELSGHWLKEAERLRGVHRFKAAIGAYREALHLRPDPKTREKLKEVVGRQVELDDLFAKLGHTGGKRDKAIELLNKILVIKPNDTRAHEELGTLYAMSGEPIKAVPYLEGVAKHDPGNAAGVTRLAWMAHVDGRPSDAADLCAEADKLEPGHPGNHFVWGMALLDQKLWAAAEKHLRLALRADPANGSANRGLSVALRRQGNVKEALLFARRAVHWTDSENAEALVALADAYAAAKRPADEKAALAKALPLAQRHHPGLAAEIGARLDQLQK